MGYPSRLTRAVGLGEDDRAAGLGENDRAAGLGEGVYEEDDVDVGDEIAEQVALPPGGGAVSMQSAPSGGSPRLSSQLPGCRTLPLQRRMISEPPLPPTQ